MQEVLDLFFSEKIWKHVGLKSTPNRKERGNLKSNKVSGLSRLASDRLELVRAVYKDACTKCIADVSDLRDLETIKSRVEKEGISFLTITLPNFSRDFERCLASGFVDPSCFRSFKKHGLIPAFLRGIIGQIFDHETGRIYDENNCTNWSDFPTLVESVRQICCTFKKIKDDCTPSRVAASLRSFSSIEHELQSFTPRPEDIQDFSCISSMLWNGLLADIQLADLQPKHGPGATADRLSGNQKYRWSSWNERLEVYFPFLGCAIPIGAYDSKEFEIVRYVSDQDETPVKVCPVPKTMKSPRIIAIEPVAMQYVQQSIQDVLYERIESASLTSGHVNFTDQSVNQGLALKSSEDGSFATIDLSDASDRVPLDLAIRMFDVNPDLQDAILACRSTRARLPDGTVIGPLRKFASMGSALCFPIEAMYFYTICVVAILRQHYLSDLESREKDSEKYFSDSLSLRSFRAYASKYLKEICSQVYVYGDDIIVPINAANTVLEYLQKYNCKVNALKTFVSGNFRESCGVDAFRGYEVNPVYVRYSHPKNRHQSSEIISWVETANSFYKKGYWSSASYMFSTCERIVGRLPYVGDDSEAIGRVSFLGYRGYRSTEMCFRPVDSSVERWNSKFQRHEIKALSPRPVYRSDMIDGYSALGKSLHDLRSLDLLSDLSRDRRHLERSALYGAVALTRRWVSAT